MQQRQEILLICRSVELRRESNSSITLANRLVAIYYDVFLPPATCAGVRVSVILTLTEIKQKKQLAKILYA